MPPWFNQIRKTLMGFQNLIVDMTMSFITSTLISGDVLTNVAFRDGGIYCQKLEGIVHF